VLGDQRGLGHHDVPELVFKRCRNTGMQLLATAAQQGSIGGFLHQRVLEGVFRIGGRPAPEDQFGVHKLRQGVIQLLPRHCRHRTDQLM
jgi:hypothetical protein